VYTVKRYLFLFPLLFCLWSCTEPEIPVPPAPPPATESEAPLPETEILLSKEIPQYTVTVTEYDTFLLKELPREYFGYRLWESSDPQAALTEAAVPLPSGNWHLRFNQRPIYTRPQDQREYIYYCQNAVIDPDGQMLVPYYDNIFSGMVLELADGTMINHHITPDGMGIYINGVRAEPPLQNTLPRTAFMVYEDTYYMGTRFLCDCFHYAYDCFGLHHNRRFALYRNLEKLTDELYYDIYRTENAFVALRKSDGIYYTDLLDDNGTVTHTEEGDCRDAYPLLETKPIADPYTICQDPLSGLFAYTCTDETGSTVQVCQPMFTACTEVYQGHAIVIYNQTMCILEMQ